MVAACDIGVSRSTRSGTAAPLVRYDTSRSASSSGLSRIHPLSSNADTYVAAGGHSMAEQPSAVGSGLPDEGRRWSWRWARTVEPAGRNEGTEAGAERQPFTCTGSAGSPGGKRPDGY